MTITCIMPLYVGRVISAIINYVENLTKTDGVYCQCCAGNSLPQLRQSSQRGVCYVSDGKETDLCQASTGVRWNEATAESKG